MISDEKIGPDKLSLTSGENITKLRNILKKPSDRNIPHDGNGNRPSVCNRLKELFGGRNARSNVGTCLAVFAVPLLIPGVTLTAVAFDDETGFAKYGALHVLGMVMLSSAGVLIIVGVMLNISFDNEVNPEGGHRSLSTHEKSLKNLEKNPDAQELSREATQNDESSGHTSQATNSKLQVNFMVESGYAAQRDSHLHFQRESVGAFPPLMADPNRTHQEPIVGVNNGYVSSSDDDTSDNTDNRSSGSYILHQESEANISSGVFCSQDKTMNVDERQNVSLEQGNSRDGFKDNVVCYEYQTDGIGRILPLESRNSKSSNNALVSSPLQHNNFFQNKDEVKRPTNLSIGTGKALRIPRNDIDILPGEKDPVPPTKNSNDPTNENSQLVSSPKQTSPRARLGGFSNASALANSLQMSNSEELLPKHLGVESFGSNVSVFSQNGEVKDGRGVNEKCLQENVTHLTKTFSFDMFKSHQDSIISHESGPVVVDHHNKAEYTARPSLATALTKTSEEEQVSRHKGFLFHATEDSDSNHGFFDSDSDSRQAIRSPQPLKPKKRQAFSFPQSRSSSSPSFSHLVRQSAPPSLLVSTQESDENV